MKYRNSLNVVSTKWNENEEDWNLRLDAQRDFQQNYRAGQANEKKELLKQKDAKRKKIERRSLPPYNLFRFSGDFRELTIAPSPHFCIISCVQKSPEL